MKKGFIFLLNCVITALLLMGCGSDNKTENAKVEEKMEDFTGKDVEDESNMISDIKEEDIENLKDDENLDGVDVNPDDIGKTFIDGNYEYTVLEDGTAKLTYYSGDEAIVNVPEMVGKYKVSVIGKACFTHELTDDKEITRTNIEEIMVPGCIKEIEEYGINLPHGNLNKIIFEDGTKRIAPILGSQELKVIVTIPNNLDYLGSIANIDFENLEQYGNLYYLNNIVIDVIDTEDENVEFKAGTRGIAKFAFSNWKGESIEIPEGVVFIAEKAFDGSNCKNYTLPKSLEEIESLGGKFYGYSDSYAERYAQEHGITFVTLE